MFGIFGGGTFAFLVMWGSISNPQFAGFEDRQFSMACDESARHKGAVVLEVRVIRSGYTYANICDTPRCSEPPATVVASKVECRRVPEKKKERVEIVPEHWEAGPEPHVHELGTSTYTTISFDRGIQISSTLFRVDHSSR